MTAVSLLFLLLLAMASFLVYRAVQHITGRFFPSDAGGFSGGLHLLRRSLFCGGVRRRARFAPCPARRGIRARRRRRTRRRVRRTDGRCGKSSAPRRQRRGRRATARGSRRGFQRRARRTERTICRQKRRRRTDRSVSRRKRTARLRAVFRRLTIRRTAARSIPGLAPVGTTLRTRGKHPPGSGPYGTVRGQRRYIGGRGARRHPGGHDGLLHGGRQRPAPGPELLLFEAGQRGALMRRVGGAGPAALFQMRLTRRKAYP